MITDFEPLDVYPDLDDLRYRGLSYFELPARLRHIGMTLFSQMMSPLSRMMIYLHPLIHKYPVLLLNSFRERVNILHPGLVYTKSLNLSLEKLAFPRRSGLPLHGGGADNGVGGQIHHSYNGR